MRNYCCINNRNRLIVPLRAVQSAVVALLSCLAMPCAGWCQEGEIAENAQEAAAPEAPPAVVEVEAEAIPLDPLVEYLLRYAVRERGLVKRVCKPTEQQLAALKAVDKAWIVREIGIARVTLAENLLVGVGRFVGDLLVQQQVNFNYDNVEIVATVCKRINKTFLKSLDESQQQLYRAEMANRERFERETSVEWLLVDLDDKLVLTRDQRDALRPKLIAWVEGEPLLTQPVRFTDHYLPTIPESVVKKSLSPSQLNTFRSLPKVAFDRLEFERQNINHIHLPVFRED